ncbi:hypothetical protein V5O48_018676, partial [Marasmius crinis-equi]
MGQGIIQKKRVVVVDSSDEEEGDNGDSMDPQNFDLVLGRLMGVSTELAALFKRTFSLNSRIDIKLKRMYGLFFEQVAGNESALQVINPGRLPNLQAFINKPEWSTASRLVDIPVIYNLLEAEIRTNGGYPKDLID